MLVSVLEYTIYVKKENENYKKRLEATIENIDKKESEIEIYKEKLEQIKETKQIREGQETKIEEQEQIKNDLNKEKENNKKELNNLENELTN